MQIYNISTIYKEMKSEGMIVSDNQVYKEKLSSRDQVIDNVKEMGPLIAGAAIRIRRHSAWAIGSRPSQAERPQGYAHNLRLRRRVHLFAHKPRFEYLGVSDFFRMAFVRQSKNILVHDDEVR